MPDPFSGKARLDENAPVELLYKRQDHFSGKDDMKIAITGASGLVGSGLMHYLKALGHELYPLVRKIGNNSHRDIYWNFAAGEIDSGALEGLDAVIHLAGENLTGYWTRAKKERILSSRRDGTRFLAEAVAGLKNPPRVFVSASAIGFYGDRGDIQLDESTPLGRGFLADVCAEWEAAAEPARQAGIRVVHPRFGIILDKNGGALAKLLPLLRWGLGGKLGRGHQYWSWITMQDVHRGLAFVLEQPQLSGAFNFTAPAPVSNAVFTKEAARLLHRPAFFTVPAFVLRTVMGEMAQEMLLNSARVVPGRLLEAGFQFEHPDLGTALEEILA